MLRENVTNLDAVLFTHPHKDHIAGLDDIRAFNFFSGKPMPAFPTSTTVLDSILFRDAFGTPTMREVFSDFSLISRYAEVEIALAKAEARCGVIPAGPARDAPTLVRSTAAHCRINRVELTRTDGERAADPPGLSRLAWVSVVAAKDSKSSAASNHF